ncbi:glycosyltransferase [Puia sp. P3]|uniref:glycosyltransferase n=1 Tax=Puia sp. P3 TaxID=3423952 RepID=UPI003D664824
MMEDGVSGFLFDHAEPGSFARQLQKILALPDETVFQIGASARRWVQDKYSFSTIGPRKAGILRDLKSRAERQFPFLYQGKDGPSGQ